MLIGMGGILRFGAGVESTPARRTRKSGAPTSARAGDVDRPPISLAIQLVFRDMA